MLPSERSPAPPAGLPAAAPPPLAGLADVPPRQFTSEALLGQGREALIEHLGSVYRLRLTSSGKLILTK
jgi:hemin uptake protein HemP